MFLPHAKSHSNDTIFAKKLENRVQKSPFSVKKLGNRVFPTFRIPGKKTRFSDRNAPPKTTQNTRAGPVGSLGSLGKPF